MSRPEIVFRGKAPDVFTMWNGRNESGIPGYDFKVEG